MKKVCCALLATIMAFSLAACGQSAVSSSQSQQSGSGSEAEVSSSSAESSSPGSASAESSASGQEEQISEPESTNGTLVVYFSASGNTEAVAETLADTLEADIYELVPEEPYTDADLNWNDPDSRVNAEHEDPNHRTAIAGGIPDLSGYDTILLGYPLWWREAPSIVWNFVENSDLAGKTIIPFCTSMSDGIGSSDDTLAGMAPDANWVEGQRFGENLDTAAVTQWAESLGLDKAAANTSASQTDEASLVVYFSMPETTDPNNMTQDEEQSTVVINGEVLGNTQYMAYVIQETTGADIFRIEPATPYPTDHDTLVDQAAEEQEQNARPVIAGQVDNMADYDVIYLGYPNWWGDMPMILYTFLEQYDLSGKTIVPFNTHGGSGFSGTIGTIRELEPDAQVLDGLSISRNDIQDARQEIVDWVSGLDIAA